MNTNNMHVPNVAAFLGISDFVKTIGDKIKIVDNVLKVRKSLFVVGNLHELEKAPEWNRFTSLNLADFSMSSCSTEYQMKEVIKMNQSTQCSIENINDAAFTCHHEDVENGNYSAEGKSHACFM